MNERFLATPEACLRALDQIQADPLDLPGAVQAHVDQCPACAEAQVAWLTQEDSGLGLAPAGYFEQLPGRVLAKLPPRPRQARRKPLWWAAAAALFLAVGTGGFLVGLKHRTHAVIEATLAVPIPETYEILPDTPFLEGEAASDPLPSLSTEDLQPLPEPGPPQKDPP